MALTSYGFFYERVSRKFIIFSNERMFCHTLPMRWAKINHIIFHKINSHTRDFSKESRVRGTGYFTHNINLSTTKLWYNHFEKRIEEGEK